MSCQNNTSLAVVIHAEEEFDWEKGFFRTNTSVSHGKELIAFCEQILAMGVKITFAIDYAFISSEQGKQVISHFLPLINKSVEFSAHLHPWVNPPFDTDTTEETEYFSYPGNLTKTNEQAKLEALSSAIHKITGQQPTTYLAGRYGTGKNTAEILKKLGYSTDLSITPFLNLSDEQGPDFSCYNNNVFTENGIVNFPHTSGFVSYFPIVSHHLNKEPKYFKLFNDAVLGKILLKLMGVKRYRLSPEGNGFQAMKKLTTSLTSANTNNLMLSFHSPSVKVGLTPYVTTDIELNAFYNNIFDYITWFKDEISNNFILAGSVRK
ncbi:hypothetical protein AAD001_13190 [Colwelliaceae bacterium 6471]